MSEDYYSAEQVICLVAFGSTAFPSDPEEEKLRQQILERWGSDILQYQPVE